jgi:putative ABC transport system permease protein
MMAHKLRTLLTVLSIAVGVGGVVAMVSAGQGTEQRILQSIRNMGTNLIVVSAGQTRIMAGRKRQVGRVTTLEPSDANAILDNCPSVAAVSPVVTKKIAARWEIGVVPTVVIGMAPEAFEIRNISTAKGRTFTAEESRAKRRVAVLGPTAARNLFGENDPLGARIRLARTPFEVIGLTTSKGMDAFGVDQDDLIYVPLDTAMRRLMNISHIDAIYVRANGVNQLTEAEDEIRELLRQRHRLEGKPDDFTIQNQATLIAVERDTVRDMTRLVGSVAAISLIVGGLGILAVMMLSVRERTREIGLRRAVGARQKDIRCQFLIESTILALTGGVVGVFCGYGIAAILSLLGYWEPVISLPVTVLAVLSSSLLGTVFGLYPAIRAAQLEPIRALESE